MKFFSTAYDKYVGDIRMSRTSRLRMHIAPGKRFVGKHYIVHIQKKIAEPDKHESDETEVYLARDQYNNQRFYTFKIVYDGLYPATLVLKQEADFYKKMLDKPTRCPVPRFRESGIINVKRPDDLLNYPYRYLIKDYLPGKPISLYNELLFSTILWILKVSLQTLAEYEAAGFLHGDLKGKHIILETGGFLPFCGLIDASGFRIPVGGEERGSFVGGTGLYMPPEELETMKPSSARDIYGVGSLFQQILRNVPYNERQSCLTSEVFKLLRQATHRDPSKRPQSIAIMAQTFNDVFQSGAIDKFNDFMVEIPQGIY